MIVREGRSVVTKDVLERRTVTKSQEGADGNGPYLRDGGDPATHKPIKL